jgi:hypothetical protein
VNRPIHIYGLTHPDTGVVWYVGASGHPSLRVRAHRAKGAAKNVRTWIASLDFPPTKIILETVTLKNWRERERHWIITSLATNPKLLNIHEGGEGPIGYDRASLKRTNIYLTDRQMTELRKEAKKLGVPLAELIRRIFDTHIEKAGK